MSGYFWAQCLFVFLKIVLGDSMSWALVLFPTILLLVFVFILCAIVFLAAI